MKGGHILTMLKTVESFQAAGLKWLGHFFGFLHENKPAPYKPKPNAWLKPSNASYVYIVVQVDDMAVVMLCPKEFLQLLIDKYKLKLKSTANGSLHLGYKYVSNDVTLVHYVDATLYNYLLTGICVTKILHLASVIQVTLLCKCPSIVEMATHESEFNMPGDTNGMCIYGPGTDKNG
jgi:hypothetical protein